MGPNENSFFKKPAFGRFFLLSNRFSKVSPDQTVSIPASDSESSGDPSCWLGPVSHEVCCAVAAFGAEGNRHCWSLGFGFERCCAARLVSFFFLFEGAMQKEKNGEGGKGRDRDFCFEHGVKF